ncbi:MAG TPA: 3'-5' exonuclease [Rhodocyclaceae bacterium]|nr:3'-5' exonuclease [Rhodocyclaceae bacterium]
MLVDEFQDTNRLQYLWLKLLAGGGAHLFCVGDDDQSIYAFRGAEIGNMRDFEREFRVPNVIRLEQNYRSHGNILDAANAIIKHNVARLGKNLWTEAGAGEPLRLFEAPSDGEEARWIVEELKALAADGMARSQMAVLYRSNAQSRVLEHALFAAGMPYRVWGGLRFFERQEVKHALAYLRLIANPHDDTAFSRVVNFPPRGIGARSLELLQDTARAAGVSLFAAIRKLAGAPAAKLGAFESLILDLERGAGDIPLPELVDHVVDLAGLRAHYRSEREGQDRLANLDELVNAAANFIAEEEEPSLANFLAHASLEAGEHQAEQGAEAVQLMTVHSAKGLEFDVVFVSGLEEGLFPHENAVQERGGLEEERRLMYVAVTRARQRLYLSLAQTRMLHGQTRYNLRSRFLEEIPANLLKWLTPPARAGYAAEPPRYYEPGTAVSSAPRRAARTGGEAGGFRIGQTVMHAKFGQGVIVDAEGSGGDARVQVNFGREGMKWLALAYAKLTPA